MWIVSLVLIIMKYYGAIPLDWGTVLIAAMSPVWLPPLFAYLFAVRATKTATRSRRRTRRRVTPLL